MDTKSTQDTVVRPVDPTVKRSTPSNCMRLKFYPGDDDEDDHGKHHKHHKKHNDDY